MGNFSQIDKFFVIYTLYYFLFGLSSFWGLEYIVFGQNGFVDCWLGDGGFNDWRFLVPTIQSLLKVYKCQWLICS